MAECDSAKNLFGEQNLQLQIYDDFESLRNMQSEWDAFMEAVDAEIFLSFDWCRIWWKYYGKKRKLAVFIFRDGNNICAILPLFLEKIWLGPIFVRAIRIVGSDYMPVTLSVPVKKDFVDTVVRMLAHEIKMRWRWDIFYLGALSGRYALTDQLAHAFEQALGNAYHIEVKSNDVQTYFQVAESWEKQVAGLAQNAKKNVRKTYREINDNKIRISSSLASNVDILEMFNKFVKMHQNHWEKLGMPGHFQAWPASFDFHHEVAKIQLKHDRLRLIETKFDDQIVGYVYIYKFNNTYYAFLNARSEDKINPRIDYKWIDFKQMIENALKDGVNCIDAMRGRYEYKLLMGGQYFPIRNLFIYSEKLPNLMRIKLFQSFAWFLDVCYSKLWNARIGPRLGVRRKAFWNHWIRFHPLAH